MSEQSRALLKTWFETGDTPTQAQFADLLDSYVSISDDLLTSGTILFAAVTAQVAQLKTLNSAPFEIIAPPGVGKWIRPISIQSRMTFGGVAYANNLDPVVKIDTALDDIATLVPGWLGAGATQFLNWIPAAGTIAQDQYVLNKALQLINTVGDSINGTSLVEFFVLYQIITG